MAHLPVAKLFRSFKRLYLFVRSFVRDVIKQISAPTTRPINRLSVRCEKIVADEFEDVLVVAGLTISVSLSLILAEVVIG